MFGNWGRVLSYTSSFVIIIIIKKLLSVMSHSLALFWFCCVSYILYLTLSGGEMINWNEYILNSQAFIVSYYSKLGQLFLALPLMHKRSFRWKLSGNLFYL